MRESHGVAEVAANWRPSRRQLCLTLDLLGRVPVYVTYKRCFTERIYCTTTARAALTLVVDSFSMDYVV